MDEERGAIIELLETYKCLPCLWDNSDNFYAVKQAREQANEILLEKYRKIDKDGTIDDMKKRIENMRTAYRREYRKVLKYGHQHYPKLWYYKYLTFLNDDRDVPGRKRKSQSEDEEYLNESMLESAELMYLEEPSEKKIKVDTEYLLDDGNDDVQLDSKSQASDNYSTLKDSATESFGKTVGLQLKELSHKQRIIAEKLISEIIFYGRQKKLEFDSTFNC